MTDPFPPIPLVGLGTAVGDTPAGVVGVGVFVGVVAARTLIVKGVVPIKTFLGPSATVPCSLVSPTIVFGAILTVALPNSLVLKEILAKIPWPCFGVAFVGR